MTHAHTPLAAQKSAQSKTPSAPAQTAPIPLDPSLLRHVGGGAPTKTW